MKKKIILIGTGINTNQIIYEIEKLKDFKILGIIFFKKKIIKKFSNYPILGNINLLKDAKYKKCEILITLGDTVLREEIVKNLNKLKIKNNFFTLISKNCIIANSSEVQQGSILMTGSIVNANSKIGKHCLVNTSAVIEHNSSVGNYCNIGPKSVIAGKTKIGNQVNINIASTVIDNLQICDHVTIGANSLVIKNIKKPGIYFGEPVKKVR